MADDIALIEAATNAVRDEVGSQLCAWINNDTECVCREETTGVCLCEAAARAVLSVTAPIAQAEAREEAKNQELRMQGLCNCGEFEGRLAIAQAEAWEEAAKWHEEKQEFWTARYKATQRVYRVADSELDFAVEIHKEAAAHFRARAAEHKP